MPNTFILVPPEDFSFAHTVNSHGWSDLPPFELDEAEMTLSYVSVGAQGPLSIKIIDDPIGLKIETTAAAADIDRIVQEVRHILRLDDDLSDFYSAVNREIGLAWVAREKAGRLLRSPTVFEDLVKTMCTTNCSWGLTKKMVSNLVEKLGSETGDGKRAFPTPEALAGVTEEFFREEIRAGYRSPYFVELAETMASGTLKPEEWLHSELETAELKKQIKSVKGFGDYAAENLLKLLGRYDGLALDSWLRAQFYKKHGGDKVCKDKKIEKHYKKFGRWQGLAIWCDMTESWFEAEELKA